MEISVLTSDDRRVNLCLKMIAEVFHTNICMANTVEDIFRAVVINQWTQPPFISLQYMRGLDRHHLQVSLRVFVSSLKLNFRRVGWI